MKIRKLTLCCAMTILWMSACSVASEWQPQASDKLMTLPANIIEKRIEQDFSASPMARRLADLDSQMQDKTARIDQLQNSLQTADQGTLADVKYALVQEKSDYLDLLQESHQLRKQASMQKQQVYQQVLQKFRHQQTTANGSTRIQLKQKQEAALARMEKVMAEVDQNLIHAGFNQTSPYADEYAGNLAQIEQLKKAIASHQGNASPTLNGAQVSSEEYLRQLLMDIAMHRSLLDQEGLMLSYMARLVALDAQELEYQLAYGDSADGNKTGVVNQASQAVDLFIL
ncbi:hypothetical protein [Alteromonas sp. C1M14]|uniref:hypothetical protein n=1 Tax=Alteromonas sp. C1M14 TaxID=2841567 RepID=UPI001C095291|nr:hypothetical protein [Alteromonas sp. C1M14]MBU2978213.1 hypothetical protein [Alteromonas sp. C1M14]